MRFDQLSNSHLKIKIKVEHDSSQNMALIDSFSGEAIGLKKEVVVRHFVKCSRVY